MACRRCSNNIFILDLTPGFIELGKDNCKTKRETFRFWDLVRLILEILRYSIPNNALHLMDAYGVVDFGLYWPRKWLYLWWKLTIILQKRKINNLCSPVVFILWVWRIYIKINYSSPPERAKTKIHDTISCHDPHYFNEWGPCKVTRVWPSHKSTEMQSSSDISLTAWRYQNSDYPRHNQDQSQKI